MYYTLYDEHASLLEVWVLAIIAQDPTHAYDVPHRIAAETLMYYCPNPESVRGVVKRLLKRGLIELYAIEDGDRSPHSRKLYALTQAGETELRRQRRMLVLHTQAIDRALARIFLREVGVD